MKTAMQEFIEYLEGIEKRDNLPSWIITTGKNYLEKEKQQIIDAYHEGCADWDNDLSDGKTHYKETFKND